MSDYIRVKLTPAEAMALAHIASMAGEREIAAKIREAQKNPLNGPTFPAVAGK